MADKKISELTNITGANLADADEFVVVDTSASETKAITWADLKVSLNAGTSFVSTTGGTMTGDLTFGDNNKARFGAGPDLVIYHNGTASYISEQGTGDLNIFGSNNIVLGSGTETYLQATLNGAVTAYYDNVAKLATTSTGVAVTGNITVSGTVDGRDVASDGTKLDGIEAGANVTDAANVEPLVDAHLNYSTATSGQVLSYNGTDYDWITLSGGSSGTVTSVAQTVPTGFTVSGSPITTAGTLAISYATGYQGYTTAEASKLSGIEAGADVTDTTNVTAAGALMDSELASVTAVKAINQGLTTTSSPTFATLNATTVDLGNWTVTESAGVLYFATGGTNRMKLDASGNLTVTGNITAYGTV